MGRALTKAEKEAAAAAKADLERPIVVVRATEEIPDGRSVPREAAKLASLLRGRGAAVRVTYACAVYPPTPSRKRSVIVHTFAVRWRTDAERGYAMYGDAVPGTPDRVGIWRRGDHLPQHMNVTALGEVLGAGGP